MSSVEIRKQKDMLTQISLYAYKKNFLAYVKFITENVEDRMEDAESKDIHKGSLEILELMKNKIEEDLQYG